MDEDIVVWDIETSPNIGLFWSAGYKLTIPPENIIRERAIVCISWLVLGKPKVHSLTWDEKQNDKAMIKAFIQRLNSCRFNVAHNGLKFDLRWLRGRAMMHQLPMWPHYVTVDTLRVVKRLAYLNSNKLDYLGEYFGLGRKQHVGFDLWKRVLLDNDPASLKKMVRYNRQDVKLLAAVYERIRKYAQSVDSVGNDISACPNCASYNTYVSKTRRTAAGSDKVQFQCKDCGQYHTTSTRRYDKAKGAQRNGRH